MLLFTYITYRNIAHHIALFFFASLLFAPHHELYIVYFYHLCFYHLCASSILPCTPRLADSTPIAFLPSLQSFCSLLASAHSVSVDRFSSPFFFFLVTSTWILARHTSPSVLSTSAPYSTLPHSHPPSLSIDPARYRKPLETHSLCCWLVLLRVCPQPSSSSLSSLVSSASDNSKRLWQAVSKLLHRKSSSPLPTTSADTSLADSFASLFIGKISKLRISLTSNPATSCVHSPSPRPNFSVFTPASESEIHRSNCPSKQSDWDPQKWLLKECSSVLVSTVTNVVNLSLTSGQFHPTPTLLKKPTLDKEELPNYRPVSDLSPI